MIPTANNRTDSKIVNDCVGADSISAHPLLRAAGRADMESAPTHLNNEGCAHRYPIVLWCALRLQIQKKRDSAKNGRVLK